MKKMMSNKKFLAITIPVASFLLALIIVLAILAQDTLVGGILNAYAGLGESYVVTVPGSENWDKEYYKLNGQTAEDVSDFAKQTTEAIAGEGMVLLKNDPDVLPLKTSKTGDTDKKVSVFGRRSVDTVYGGTGSGSGDATQCTPLLTALANAGYQTNPTLTDAINTAKSGVPIATCRAMDDITKTTYYIGELPKTNYTAANVASSYSEYDDAAIVVLGREGGEGRDYAGNLKDRMADSGSPLSSPDMVANSETANYTADQHQLELSREEKDMLDVVKSNFDKVIVLLNSANVMELGELEADPEIDSIIWMSYPGSRGNDALADLLNGTLNFSGRTVDTWMSDMTADPSFNNTYSYAYSNVNSSNATDTTYVVEYEEGIYIGYRYYETRGYIEGEEWYDDAVTYPFGYGLSYTTFNQEIVGEPVVADGQISLTVKVTNTGRVAGKDVIQLYYTAPYEEGGVEKSHVVLAAYDKTDILEPGAENAKEYTLSFAIEDMASYDYKTEGCYVLDAGDYTISLRKNAHELWSNDSTFVYTQEERIVYDEDNPRQTEIEAQTGDAVNYSDEWKEEHEVIAAVNRFDDLNEHFVEYDEAKSGYGVNMTRENFAQSFPTAMTAADLVASDEVIAGLQDFDPNDYYDSTDTIPTQGADGNLTIAAMRGRTFDDPMWDDLIDQLSVTQMANFLRDGNQKTNKLDSIGLPQTKASDGPAGLKQYGGLGLSTTGNFNCSATLVAATWNFELAEQYGIAVGQECLTSSPIITGWYAPGLNIHRSPFGGRNFEYYSEDPLLSGMTCAGTVQGAAKMGVESYIKHFVVNDLETHRTANGPVTWLNEQALREIYLRAFEVAVKVPEIELNYLEYITDEDGNTTGAEMKTKTIRGNMAIMSAFNRIGTQWVGGRSDILNDVLRGEWGFLGAVITDFNGGAAYMNCELGITSGNDLMLSNIAQLDLANNKIADEDNPSTVIAMRTAMHNVLYSHANSNAMQGLASGDITKYKLAPWRIILIVIEVVLALGVAALVTFSVLHTIKWKKYNAAKQTEAPAENAEDTANSDRSNR